MATATTVLLWAHWGGLALLVVGYVMTLASGVINPVMVWAARLQLLLGLVMVGVMEMAGGSMNHMWVGIKLVIALAVVALCEIASSRAKKGRNTPVLHHIAFALVVLNAVYAMFGL